MSKICTIFMVLFLAQTTFGKYIEMTVEAKTLAHDQQLFIYVGANFIAMVEEYALQSSKVCRDILKDETFLANHKPEVLEFKKNIQEFIESYDANKDFEKLIEIYDKFSKTTDYYDEVPEDKVTPESKFIVEMLDKHHYNEIEDALAKDFDPFITKFSKMFYEYSGVLDKPMLDWYKKYKSITDFDDKLEAFNEFLSLAVHDKE